MRPAAVHTLGTLHCAQYHLLGATANAAESAPRPLTKLTFAPSSAPVGPNGVPTW